MAATAKQAVEVKLEKSTIEMIVEAYERRQEAKKRGEFERTKRNITRLLEQYGKLYDFIENAVVDETKSTERKLAETLALMGDERRLVRLDGLLYKTAETRLYLNHLNALIEAFRSNAERQNDERALRQYRILVNRYMVEMPMKDDEIMTQESISKTSYYRDIADVVNELVYLWLGVGGFDYDNRKTALTKIGKKSGLTREYEA